MSDQKPNYERTTQERVLEVVNLLPSYSPDGVDPKPRIINFKVMGGHTIHIFDYTTQPHLNEPTTDINHFPKELCAGTIVGDEITLCSLYEWRMAIATFHGRWVVTILTRPPHHPQKPLSSEELARFISSLSEESLRTKVTHHFLTHPPASTVEDFLETVHGIRCWLDGHRSGHSPSILQI